MDLAEELKSNASMRNAAYQDIVRRYYNVRVNPKKSNGKPCPKESTQTYSGPYRRKTSSKLGRPLKGHQGQPPRHLPPGRPPRQKNALPEECGTSHKVQLVITYSLFSVIIFVLRNSFHHHKFGKSVSST